MTNIYDELKAEMGFDPEKSPAPLPLPTLAGAAFPKPELESVAEALVVVGEAGLMTEGLAELQELVAETVAAEEV